MKVRFTPEARARVAIVGTWWRRHGMVPELFERELGDALETLLARPTLGIAYRAARGRVVRRIQMSKTQQHLYYSVDENEHVIIVHVIWGARRGLGPKLEPP